MRNHDEDIEAITNAYGSRIGSDHARIMGMGFQVGEKGRVYSQAFPQEGGGGPKVTIMVYQKRIIDPHTNKELSSWMGIETRIAMGEKRVFPSPLDPVYLSRNGEVLLNIANPRITRGIEKLAEMARNRTNIEEVAAEMNLQGRF
jgi:hypothetical protein